MPRTAKLPHSEAFDAAPVARKSSLRVVPKPPASRFEQFRGIGNPGLPTGRRALLKHLRDMRDGK